MAGTLADRRRGQWLAALWALFVVVSLFLLSTGNLTVYGIGIPLGALVLVVLSARDNFFAPVKVTWARWSIDTEDVAAVVLLYVAVVGLFKLAFGGFGTAQTLPFFLTYAAGMLVGVVGPIFYTVWVRRRTLESLGIGLHNLGSTAALALVFAAMQFVVTLWGVALPAPVDWVPLLLMSITVGAFEAVFFRGFIQGTLEQSIGVAPAVGVAAALYSLYHIGYGMGPSDMLFLFGLGVVYTVAFRVTRNLLAIWPLLTPMGGFFSQLKAGEMQGQLPWISMLGFGEVLAVFAIAIYVAARVERRHASRARPARAVPA